MRKLFNDRARLVVYLEQAELDAMASNAKRYGQTLQEWARGVLTSSVQRVVEVEVTTPIIVKKPLAHMRIDGLGVPGQCEHKKKPGELCYKCDPKMGYPNLK